MSTSSSFPSACPCLDGDTATPPPPPPLPSFNVCIIHTENSLKWAPVSFGDMFINILSFEEFNVVPVFHVCEIANGEKLHPEQAIRAYDAFVITGSRFNVRDDLDWYHSLIELIRLAASSPDARMYGGCFGAQIIGHALGGRVDLNDVTRLLRKTAEY